MQVRSLSAGPSCLSSSPFWCSQHNSLFDDTDSHRVYIDSQGTIYDVTLNQTDAVSNHNKFYRLQLLEGTMMEDFRVWTRWGRVGENGQNLLIKGVEELEDAQKAFRKKFKDKTGYTWEDSKYSRSLSSNTVERLTQRFQERMPQVLRRANTLSSSATMTMT